MNEFKSAKNVNDRNVACEQNADTDFVNAYVEFVENCRSYNLY